MSKRGKQKESFEFVKHVPDFIAKMGLSRAQLKEHNEKNREHKIEDKFQKKNKEEETDENEDYDFENAQIEDLANMLQGGPVSDGAGGVALD